MVSAELDADRWAEHVFLAFEAVVKLAPVGRELVGWWELTRPPPSNGVDGQRDALRAPWALLQAASDAGELYGGLRPRDAADVGHPPIAPVGKRGDGSHPRSRRRRASRWTRTPSGARRWRWTALKTVLIAAARERDRAAVADFVRWEAGSETRIPRGRNGMSVASLRNRLAEAYAALSLPGWLDVHHRRQPPAVGRQAGADLVVVVLAGRSSDRRVPPGWRRGARRRPARPARAQAVARSEPVSRYDHLLGAIAATAAR